MSASSNSNTSFKISDLQSWSTAVPSNNRGPLIIALTVLLAVFGIGGYWAATAPLGGAVITSGRIVAKGSNIAVQNLEGGILARILVIEGQAVKRGDILAKMDTTSVSSQLQRVRIDRAISMIELARWRAERDGTSIALDTDILEGLGDHPRVREALSSQTAESKSAHEAFLQELRSIDGEIQNEEEDLSYLSSQLEQTGLQLTLIGNERTNLGKLHKKGLVSNSRILSLDRELSRLEAERSNVLASIAKSRNNISSLKERKAQLHAEREVNISEKLTELQKQLTTHEDQVIRLEDILRRADLISPVDGTILNIPAKSIGAVIQPGKTIVEILPSDVALEVEAPLSPADINKVFKGQPAEIVFPSDQINVKPPLKGKVEYVSADALLDTTTQQVRYITRVSLAHDWNGRSILPGMMAEVFFQTESKTLLELLAEPVTRFARRAFSD